MPTLVAVVPHPDDETYAFGGTLALAARAGWDCVVLCASSGEGGERHDGGPTTAAEVAVAREAELVASCHVLGVTRVATLRLPDGGLSDLPGPPPELDRVLRELQPALILTLGADGAYGHHDHLAVYGWVTDAWNRAGEPCPLLFAAFPHGLFLPQYEKCLDMLGTPPRPSAKAIGAAPAHYTANIHAVRDMKLAAIAAHRSQLPGGDPEALFPPGIVAALLESEWFTDARGRPSPDLVAEMSFLALTSGAAHI